VSAPGASHVELAARILAAETRHDLTDVARGIETAFGRLHDAMFKVVGSAGYCALLVRAAHVAKREHPWLGSLEISPSPFAMAHLGEQVMGVGPEAAMLGAQALLATLLDLFCAFIGEGLTLLQIYRAWADLAPGEGRATPPKETT
jgi:hypothetical protein